MSDVIRDLAHRLALNPRDRKAALLLNQELKRSNSMDFSEEDLVVKVNANNSVISEISSSFFNFSFMALTHGGNLRHYYTTTMCLVSIPASQKGDLSNWAFKHNYSVASIDNSNNDILKKFPFFSNNSIIREKGKTGYVIYRENDIDLSRQEFISFLKNIESLKKDETTFTYFTNFRSANYLVELNDTNIKIEKNFLIKVNPMYSFYISPEIIDFGTKGLILLRVYLPFWIESSNNLFEIYKG